MAGLLSPFGSSSPPSRSSSLPSALVPHTAIAAITVAWIVVPIPDWRYPLAAIVLIAVPEAALTLAGRFLSSPLRHPGPNRRSHS